MITKRSMTKGNSKKKVLLGMSGGVDSSVAAHILIEEGFQVIGASIQMKPEEKCCTTTNISDAKKVADRLGIEYYEFDMHEEFQKCVIEYFIAEYQAGRTPNPCVVCNRFIKFETLLQKADELGIEYIATGHYVQVERDSDTKRYILKKAVDTSKDQSYVLYTLSQEQLSRAVFPLGKYEKSEIRNIAKKLGLEVAGKPDSQEICFIEDNDYNRFIKENSDIRSKPGEFVDIHGNVLGQHEGITKYTVGQRKGIGISLGIPIYVVDIDIENNRVVLASNDELFRKEFIAEKVNYISIEDLETDMKINAKIRYKAIESPATISPLSSNTVKVVFEKPQRAVTPGQSVVFYDGDTVVGGGVISK